jgi:hypothetical protein
MKSGRFWACVCQLLFLLILFPYWSAQAQDMRVVVAEGDNLVTLGKKYLDEPDDWPAVASANGLKDPHLVFPGQVLVIPAHLLKGVPAPGRATFVQGEVLIKRLDESGWSPVVMDEQILPESSIRTGADGILEISFEDGSTCYIKPESSLRITKARMRGTEHFFRDFFLEMGRVITRLHKAIGGGSRFFIRTPSATAAARGTEFRVATDQRKDTRVEVLQGTVDAGNRGRAVPLAEGEGTLVRKGMRPTEPKKLLPPPTPTFIEEAYNRMPLEFQFSPVPGAVGYRVMLASRADFKDILREVQIGSFGTASMKDLQDGSYFLRAQSIDELGLEGAPSAPISIKVRTNPKPPFIQYPLDGIEHKATSVVFKWLNVEDARKYHLQVSEDVEMVHVVEEHTDLDGSEIKTDKLAPGRYTFRIRSIAADGYRGAWSDRQTFTILPPPPVPPADPPKSDRKHIYMRWQDVGGQSTYHFQMAKDKQFEGIVHDDVVDKPEITVDKPKKSGTYYVRVSSIAPDGYEGNFSPPQSFKVNRFPYWLVGGAATVGVIILVVVL